jgi:hypothetical protein
MKSSLEMQSRTTYWQNSFPNHLELTFRLEELKLAGAFDLPDDDDPVVTEGKKAKGCFVSVNRVGLAGTSKAAVRSKLNKFVGRDSSVTRALSSKWHEPITRRHQLQQLSLFNTSIGRQLPNS